MMIKKWYENISKTRLLKTKYSDTWWHDKRTFVEVKILECYGTKLFDRNESVIWKILTLQ